MWSSVCYVFEEQWGHAYFVRLVLAHLKRGALGPSSPWSERATTPPPEKNKHINKNCGAPVGLERMNAAW